MSIYVDGERSRKRQYLVRRALDVLKANKLLVKAGIFEGFIFKAQIVGQFDKGFVLAPEGVVALLNDGTQLRKFVMDSKECAALPVGNPCTITWDAIPPTDGTMYILLGLWAANMLTSPAALSTPSGYRPANPVCLPLGGEFTNDHIAQTKAGGYELCINQTAHCYSPGHAGNNSSLIFGSGFQPVVTPGADNYAAYRFVMNSGAGYYDALDVYPGYTHYGEVAPHYPMLFTYGYMFLPAGVNGLATLTPVAAFAGITSALLAKISGKNPAIKMKVIAGYASRTYGDVKGVVASRIDIPVVVDPDHPDKVLICETTQDDDPPGETPLYYGTPSHACVHEADRKWGVVLTFFGLASSTQTLTANDLKTTLWALAGGEMSWVKTLEYPSLQYNVSDPENTDNVYQLASLVLGRLFGWPCASPANVKENYARDTVTFADSTGTVYSWLRCTDPDPETIQNAEGALFAGTRGGGFKFTYAEKITRVPIFVPKEARTDPTLRPRITRVTDSVYCCMTDKADKTSIEKMYLGDPFTEDSWQEVDFPAGLDVYAAKIIQPGGTIATCGLLAICGLTPEPDPENPEAPVFTNFSIYIRVAGGNWILLSPIPAYDVDGTKAMWDVSMFGDGPLVGASETVHQNPIVQPALKPGLR